MPTSNESIEKQVETVEEKRAKVEELQRNIAIKEAERNGDIRSAQLSREEAALDAEIARLTAVAEAVNAKGNVQAETPVTNAPVGNQRRPVEFNQSGGAPTEVKE